MDFIGNGLISDNVAYLENSLN